MHTPQNLMGKEESGIHCSRMCLINCPWTTCIEVGVGKWCVVAYLYEPTMAMALTTHGRDFELVLHERNERWNFDDCAYQACYHIHVLSALRYRISNVNGKYAECREIEHMRKQWIPGSSSPPSTMSLGTRLNVYSACLTVVWWARLSLLHPCAKRVK